MPSRALKLLIVFVLATACAQSLPRPESPEGQNIITAAEIAESHAVTAYDAIQKLRGNFLSNRGKTTILGEAPSTPVVFLDGIEYGTIERLRDIQAGSILSIRLYRAWEAAKFGFGKTGGVIDIATRIQ